MRTVRSAVAAFLTAGRFSEKIILEHWSKVLYSADVDEESQQTGSRRRSLSMRRGKPWAQHEVRRAENDMLSAGETVDQNLANSVFPIEKMPDTTVKVAAQESNPQFSKFSKADNAQVQKRDLRPEFDEEFQSVRFVDRIASKRSQKSRSVISRLHKAASSDELYTDVEFPSDVKAERESRDQAKRAYRPDINPNETSIILFPGQGAQFVGMGAKLLDYPNVEEMYRSASKILGFDLLDLCLHGPRDVLNKTVHSQPAVLVTSLAAVQKLKYENPQAIEACVSTAGYDVGEYSSLVFARAMPFDDAVRLVKTRAAAMQGASHLVSGGMAVIHFDANAKINFACLAARRYCEQELGMDDAVCEIAGFMYPGCKIFSGNQEALQFIDKNRREFGIKSVKQLPVSGAFHSRLMHSAVASMSRTLSSTRFSDPVVPVYSNVTGQRYGSSNAISRRLIEHVWKPIRWEQTMHVLFERSVGFGFPNTYEVGPGRQMGAILKLINAKAFEQYSNVDV